ncbi:HNH endonuclease [Brachybacterium endophyticum]|uniref:HNH endonuclease n=1 Tax=Brachybacterium endophyticum TaxID=2182385 RepID=A0A2U2RK86_9MICO|nr:HNH endonuclease signature motif containing protein [Brachybacterium endophyticum]PWH06194.1 HNH endonuclease [Brachybacterium endophyticum]
MGTTELPTAQGVLDVPADVSRPGVFAILDELEQMSPRVLEDLHAHDCSRDPAPAPQGVRPLRSVDTPRPVCRDVAARRISPRPDVQLTERVHALWDDGAQEASDLARRLLLLAPSWLDREAGGTDPHVVEAEDLTVAVALRCTRTQAGAAIREAHRAVDLLPRCLQALETGEFPAAWFRTLLERTRRFTDAEMLLVDVTVSSWTLGITPERFTRELNALLAMIEGAQPEPASLDPESRRRMVVDPGRSAGTACLRIIGPAPEIMALAGRFDQAARAVQDAQRHALREGTGIPLDPDGQVEREGMPLSLALIRYHLAHAASLDTDGVTVPEARFRLNVLVPFLTLAGGDDAPGMLEDGTPIPAAMAREIAGAEKDWFRVLTDPSSSEFLPCPAQRYRPTDAMLEHVRLRGRTCAVPGCTRSSSIASEADHIIEYDHADPAAGGRTEIENLHLLCWFHHAMKTSGLLDPTRIDADRSPTGRRGTLWDIQERVQIFREDDTDLLTVETVAELTSVWDSLERSRAEHTDRHAADPPTSPPVPSPAGQPAPSFAPRPGPRIVSPERSWRETAEFRADHEGPRPLMPLRPGSSGPPPF